MAFGEHRLEEVHHCTGSIKPSLQYAVKHCGCKYKTKCYKCDTVKICIARKIHVINKEKVKLGLHIDFLKKVYFEHSPAAWDPGQSWIDVTFQEKCPLNLDWYHIKEDKAIFEWSAHKSLQRIMKKYYSMEDDAEWAREMKAKLKKEYKYVELGKVNDICPICGKVENSICSNSWHSPGSIEGRKKMKDKTEKPQTEVHWNELNSAIKDNSNTFKFFTGNSLTEVMRLDKDGMIYKGNRIEDAGEAHKTFLDVMHEMKHRSHLQESIERRAAIERPNWIPYTASAVQMLLDEYQQYADYLEAENEKLRNIPQRILAIADMYEKDGEPGPLRSDWWGWRTIASDLRLAVKKALEG